MIAIGETVQRAVVASQILAKENISSTVISMHTLKPFDYDTFINSIKETRAIITLEEHSIYGGLGEQCANILSQNQIYLPFKILGIPDEYMINGSQSDVLDYYNMDPKKIVSIAKKLIKK